MLSTAPRASLTLPPCSPNYPLSARYFPFLKISLFSGPIMSRLSSFYCCVLLLALVHSSQPTFSQFGVFCKPEVGRIQVSKTGCGSRYVRAKACVGTCASYMYPLNHPPYFKKFCKCCKPSAKRWKKFNLPNCTSGISPTVQVESAVNCKCSACTWKKERNKIK